MLSTSKTVRLASPLEFDSVVNGDGLRIVVWFQGCLFECPGCHNSETWAIDGGFVYDLETLVQEIRNHTHEMIDGITFSGGDPLFQIEAVKTIIDKTKDLNLNIWLYSGEIYENLIKDPQFLEIVDEIDVLVDGRFVLKNLDLNLKYRGSTNQRLVDVKKTRLNNDEVILVKD